MKTIKKDNKGEAKNAVKLISILCIFNFHSIYIPNAANHIHNPIAKDCTTYVVL